MLRKLENCLVRTSYLCRRKDLIMTSNVVGIGNCVVRTGNNVVATEYVCRRNELNMS